MKETSLCFLLYFLQSSFDFSLTASRYGWILSFACSRVMSPTACSLLAFCAVFRRISIVVVMVAVGYEYKAIIFFSAFLSNLFSLFF